MSTIEVTAVSIPKILENLYTGEWLAPEFQRDFVWSNAQIIGLVNSIIDAKPIGMATLWQQEDQSDLPLEHIAVNDYIPESAKSGPRHFGDNNKRPGRYYAILDGKQRSTAISMVFGGLKAASGGYKYSGSYFLNAAYEDIQDRIVYLSKSKIEKRHLNSLTAYVRSGLFPLALQKFDGLVQHYFGFISSVDDDQLYEDEKQITDIEKEKRKNVIQSAYEGILGTRLAVYTVPKEETLGEICDIFETLNTTGTKVSTVDLIHSWVYAETIDSENPILLREEFDALGELTGAEHWVSSTNRPELVAQTVAAIQIALDKKHPPRPVSGRKETKITSIKSSDLLAISSPSWRDFFNQNSFVSKCFLDFQNEVAGGRFSLAQCPYPGVITIYIALRWYWEFDRNAEVHWTIEHLNKLFCSFFWRNTFSRRYDQGYLTRVGADIVEFKKFLNKTPQGSEMHTWATDADDWLNKLPLMSPRDAMLAEAENAVSDGNLRGALRSGGLLLLHARAKNDFVNLTIDISNIVNSHELHHIYPKKWCKDNKCDANAEFVENNREKRNWVDSPANLVPMSSQSNKKWDTMEPSTAFGSLNVETEDQKTQLRRYFIDDECMTYLLQGGDGIGLFMKRRSDLLKYEMLRLMKV